jgi:hypothetical protein
MAFEDDLGWEYFENDPEHSPRMQEHMDWHMAPENQNRTGNYGERFLTFHRQYIAKFDTFRVSKGLLPVSGWDPATPIPAFLAHPHTLTGARNTDDPNSINPHCATPTWATFAGGTDVDPIYGYTNLSQFQSLDELGRAIDGGWHGTVHNTIGGDMAQFHSPIDPVFWRWHKWIDDVRATWETIRLRVVIPREIVSIIRILFGVVNDAPGVVIGPDGKPHPVPGGPGDPPILSPVVREVLTGQLLQGLSAVAHVGEARQVLGELGARMIKAAGNR